MKKTCDTCLHMGDSFCAHKHGPDVSHDECSRWVAAKVPWVERDPNGLKPSDPGAKLDDGKVRAGLLKQFSRALTEVAKVSTYGAGKYSEGGWATVKDGHKRYTDAMMRHWLAEEFESIDEESGLLHMAQVAWNALARLEFYLKGDE